jgi:hypothetical protein
MMHNHGQDNGILLVGCDCPEPESGMALAAISPPPHWSEPVALAWYELYRPIYQATVAMTGRCDRAYSEDGVGWNKDDAPVGHELAGIPIEQWELGDFRNMWERLYKYRNTQLPTMGFNHASFSVPPMPGRVGRQSPFTIITR